MDSNDAPSGAACAPPSDEEPTKEHSRRPSLTVKPPQAASGIATGTVLISPTPASADRGENEQHRRQRRRMDTDSASANRPSPHTKFRLRYARRPAAWHLKDVNHSPCRDI